MGPFREGSSGFHTVQAARRTEASSPVPLPHPPVPTFGCPAGNEPRGVFRGWGAPPCVLGRSPTDSPRTGLLHAWMPKGTASFPPSRLNAGGEPSATPQMDGVLHPSAGVSTAFVLDSVNEVVLPLDIQKVIPIPASRPCWRSMRMMLSAEICRLPTFRPSRSLPPP